MSRAASSTPHSEAPFSLDIVSSPGVLRPTMFVVDAKGFVIAMLGRPPHRRQPELLANAHLFVASPALLAAAKLGRAAIAEDRALTIEAHTVPLAGTLEPDLSTLEDMAVEVIAELDARLSEIDAAIAMAEGRK